MQPILFGRIDPSIWNEFQSHLARVTEAPRYQHLTSAPDTYGTIQTSKEGITFAHVPDFRIARMPSLEKPCTIQVSPDGDILEVKISNSAHPEQDILFWEENRDAPWGRKGIENGLIRTCLQPFLDRVFREHPQALFRIQSRPRRAEVGLAS